MRISLFLLFTFYCALHSNYVSSQTCPTYVKRNNGNGGGNSDCGATTGIPSNQWDKTGSFEFSGVTENLSLLRVDKWNSSNSSWEVYQNNSSSPAIVSTFWFGSYNGVSNKICFYANGGGNGVPPAASWKFFFTPTGGSQFHCLYNINSDGTLPVTWETVSAEKQNGQSILRWSTASEQNTKDFVVQHSLNTTDWSSLSTIPAAGNSTTTRNYSYVHQNPLKGNNYNYYRILQRDLDDKFSYSKIVSIIFNEPGADLQVYPNPVQDQLTIFLAETQLVRLVNAAGATVWKGQLPAGRNTIPVHTFSKGVYVLTAGMQSQRVLIQ